MDRAKRKITIHDIAAAAGVSIATVSRALNNKDSVKENTYNKVIRVMRELGYEDVPIRHQSKLILILLPDIDNLFYSELIKGISGAADRHGFQEIILRTGAHPLTYDFIENSVMDTHADGLITLDAIADTEALEKLRAKIPLVQCAEYNDQSNGSYVSIDDIAASKMVTQYLASRGKKRIAFIDGPRRYKYSRYRLEGFQKGLELVGLEANPNFIAQLPELSYDAALSVATQMLSMAVRPDAIFTASDIIAGAALKVARRMGLRIPEDLAIIGFDNTSVSILCEPSLTSVKQPQYQMGFIACEMLIDQIKNPGTPPRQITLDVELVIREST